MDGNNVQEPGADWLTDSPYMAKIVFAGGEHDGSKMDD